jgi:hypothetical protein
MKELINLGTSLIIKKHLYGVKAAIWAEQSSIKSNLISQSQSPHEQQKEYLLLARDIHSYENIPLTLGEHL